MQRRRKLGSLNAPLPPKAAMWEHVAMLKSIWLAAGLEYRTGCEQTNINFVEEPRGCIERITEARGGKGKVDIPYLGVNNKRRLFRAVSMEALTAYVSYQNADFSRTRTTVTAKQSRQERRKMIQVLEQLEPEPQHVNDFLDPRFVSVARKVVFPESFHRAPFIELTNACPEDQALAYQHLVVRELAKKGYEMEHSFAAPNSTLLRD
eukprot:6124787-Amphidinium_carterae.1